MIFPIVELEDVVQLNDKTRLNGEKVFITPDEAAITLIEIEPEAASGYIDVTSNMYLDWQYATAGSKTVTIRVTTDGAPTSFSKTIEAVTVATDALFSVDTDITSHEPDVLNYVRAGRSSFLDIHRKSQIRIISWLNEQRIWDINGDALTKTAIINVEEVSQWSKYLSLQLIFEGLSNATDDIFHEKAIRYRAMADVAKNRGAIRLDFDGDGNQDTDETSDIRSLRMVRR